ncbi:MAG: hypothetical protein R6U63_16140 [Longimicrobiales bacterium]
MGRRAATPRAPVLGLALVLAAVFWPAAAHGQTPDPAAIRVSAFGGVSFRDGLTGLNVAKDVQSLSVRLTLPRQTEIQPWVQGEYFVRPDFECLSALPCSDAGWTALAGVTAPISTSGDTDPGVHPYLLAGVGWAFSAEDRFAYVLGVGLAMVVTHRVAPSLEFRWEDLPGIRNVLMVDLGLRLDLF